MTILLNFETPAPIKDQFRSWGHKITIWMVLAGSLRILACGSFILAWEIFEGRWAQKLISRGPQYQLYAKICVVFLAYPCVVLAPTILSLRGVLA